MMASAPLGMAGVHNGIRLPDRLRSLAVKACHQSGAQQACIHVKQIKPDAAQGRDRIHSFGNLGRDPPGRRASLDHGAGL